MIKKASHGQKIVAVFCYCENLTRCLVAVKSRQSAGSGPWQRSAGNYSNLSVTKTKTKKKHNDKINVGAASHGNCKQMQSEASLAPLSTQWG